MADSWRKVAETATYLPVRMCTVVELTTGRAQSMQVQDLRKNNSRCVSVEISCKVAHLTRWWAFFAFIGGFSVKPTVGRIVHYVMRDATESKLVSGEYVKQNAHRPAMIVRVWDRPDDEMPLVQLQVFTDGTNDGSHYSSGVSWQTSVHYSESHEPGTWHWPEREEA